MFDPAEAKMNEPERGLDAWKRVHYAKTAAKTTPQEALDHSLVKWYGLRVRELEHYGLEVNQYGHVVELDEYRDEVNLLEIDCTSCALCVHHFDRMGDGPRCQLCPIALSREGVPCDVEADGERESPWQSWLQEHDPEPMLGVLEEARDWVEFHRAQQEMAQEQLRREADKYGPERK